MQKRSIFLWRPFERKTKETFCFAKLISHLITLICYSSFIDFFLVCFSTYFKNQNIYLKKRAVEAAKGNRLSSRHVKIHLQKIHS